VLSEDFPADLSGFRPGSLLAGYRLQARIGAGGMAVVWRALDERLYRPVALKILAPGRASDAADRQRFIAEARAAAAVDDPHIIPVYEAGEAGGVLFIAMRFVPGGDLRLVLGHEGALPPDRAAEFISPVASALDAAHRARLVHRDVKPENILVDAREGRPDHVYLSDFGVAKSAMRSANLTGAGHYVGTPDYIAPEQIDGRAVDGRTDQYALACVSYELLTGVVPFRRDGAWAVLLAHMSEPPPSLLERRPDLTDDAGQVLAKAMAKVPDKRYGSCGDFADALRDALGLPPYHPRRSGTASAHSPPSNSPLPEAAPPDLLAPDLLAPDLLAPDLLAPDLLAPDLLAPDPVAADLVAAETVDAVPGGPPAAGEVSTSAAVGTGLDRPRRKTDRNAWTHPPSAADQSQLAEDAEPAAGSAEPSSEPGRPPTLVGTEAADQVAGAPDLPADPRGRPEPGSATAPAHPEHSATAPAAIWYSQTAPPVDAPSALVAAETIDAMPGGPPVAGELPAVAEAGTDLAHPDRAAEEDAGTLSSAAAAATDHGLPAATTDHGQPAGATGAAAEIDETAGEPVPPSPADVSADVPDTLAADLLAQPDQDFKTAPPPTLPSDPVAPPSDPVAPPSDPVAPPSDPVAPPSDPVAPPSDPVAPLSDLVAPPADAEMPLPDLVVPDLVVPPSDLVMSPADPVAPGADPVAPGADPVAPLSDPVAPLPDPAAVESFDAGRDGVPPGVGEMPAAAAVLAQPAQRRLGTVTAWIWRHRLPASALACAILAVAGVIPFLATGSAKSPPAAKPSTAAKPPPAATTPVYRSVRVDLPSSWRHVPATSLAFSPSGSTLAIASQDICLWKVPTTGCTTGFGSAYSVAFSPDGKTLATGIAGPNPRGGTIRLWNVAARSQTDTFTDPTSLGAFSVAFSPDGGILAAGDGNGHTYLWNVATGKLAATFTDPGSTGVKAVAFSPDGKLLVAGDGNGHAYLWNVVTRKSSAFLSDPGSAGVYSVACSPDDTTMAAGDYNGTTYVWNVVTRKLMATLPNPGGREINSVAFSANGETLATSDQGGSVYLWRAS
jgi:serine/threonine protein kinase